MLEQVQMFSRDGKLYAGMSINSIKQNAATSEKEKLKMIELFNSANTTPDDVLDENEIKAYDKKKRKSTIKKVLIGAAIVAGVCVIGYLACKGFKNSKNIVEETAKIIPESKLPLLTEEGVHERILNGEFGKLGFGSEKDVESIFSSFADKHGLKFEGGTVNIL